MRELGFLDGAPGGDAPVKIFRAADVDQTCREVLAQHQAESRPLHIQGSLLERLQTRDSRRLQALVDRGTRRFYKLRQLGKLRGSAGKALKKRIGKKFLKKTMVLMKKVKLQQEVPCYLCKQHCRVHPTEGERADSAYLIIGGSTCVSWSSMGCSAGWLHNSTAPFAVWVADFMRELPEFCHPRVCAWV